MKLKTVALYLALGATAVACDNEPAEGKAAATVTEPALEAPEPAVAEDTAGATRYAFDHEGSRVAFVGAKVTGKHDGAFRQFAGEIEVPEGKLEQGRVNVTIQSASVEADETKLTKHLKSEDFFDVGKFPEIRFVSTEVKAGGADGATHTVTGNLTMHGVTKAISFPATITQTGDAIAVAAEFAINRKDFEIVYPGMPDDLIKDDVLIKLDIKAARNEA